MKKSPTTKAEKPLSTAIRLLPMGLIIGYLSPLVALIALPPAAAAHSHSGYAYASTLGYTNLNWMTGLSDQVRLSYISIPGTHDTMAYQGQFNSSISKTQTLNLRTQLDSGIRALDVRCRHIHDRFAIHHGAVYLNASFDDVLRTVRSFLQQYPGETIVMRIKEEHTPSGNSRSFLETFNWYLGRSEYGGLFWRSALSATNPRLGDLRGKIVVLDDFPGTPDVGISYRQFSIQDRFHLRTNWDLYGKWEAVKGHLQAATDRANPNVAYINYLSGSGGSFPYFVASGHSSPGTSAPRLSTGLTTPAFSSYYPDFPRVSCFLGICTIAFEGTNTLTTDDLVRQRPEYVGILMADFPGAGLIRNTIAANDHLRAGVVDTNPCIDACNPGVFDGQRWYCRANPHLPVGTSCTSGWEVCRPGCNPGLFQGRHWSCVANRRLPTDSTCSSGWNYCYAALCE